MANGLFGGGTGTVSDPYLIEDALDLRAVEEDLTAHYKQVQDIDLQNQLWKPIVKVVVEMVDYGGSWGSMPTNVNKGFSGTYDGNGRTIRNLQIDMSEKIGDNKRGYGLFHKIHGGVVKNLSILNANIEHVDDGNSISNLGILAGYIEDGDVYNVTVQGEFKIPESTYIDTVGGLASYVNTKTKPSTFSDCKVDFKIDMGGDNTGGLASSFDGEDDFPITIERCKVQYHARTKYSTQGGLTSEINNCTVRQCYVSGYMESTEDTYSFGTCFGRMFNSTIEDCISIVEVKFGEEDVTGTNTGYFAGVIDTCTVNRTATFVSGQFPTGYNQYIQESWGRNDSDKVLNSYYDSTLAGTSASTFGIGKTTEELKNPSTYVGWDFENVWEFGEDGLELIVFTPPSEENPGEEPIENDIVIVTDVNFSKTKLIRDTLGSPIPQVWDHKNERYIPLTLQMIELMIKR